MIKEFNKLYKLALKIGEERFGSVCKHTQIRNGKRVKCLRTVRQSRTKDKLKDVEDRIREAHNDPTCNVWYHGKLVVSKGRVLDKQWLKDAVERSLKWRRKVRRVVSVLPVEKN